MSLYAQSLLDLHDELVVDCFAGGGGASSGIEQAFGRMVDIAINHDPKALSMHAANHPQTLHIQSDIFEVDPREVTHGRPVGFAWFSPDCTDHSKAKGGQPIRTKKRRSLAWVVVRWAGTVRPRVITLENVEEFRDWSPLIGKPGEYRRCPKRKGLRFRQWVKALERLGYVVEWRELRSCWFGSPTIRKRLYVIARCDGQPIVWPEPTHGDPSSLEVKAKRLKPYRAIAECIDWSIPMASIFLTKDEAKEWGISHHRPAPKRPLADNTMKRIARGVQRFVLNNPKPFLVTLAHGEESNGKKRWGATDREIDKPLGTVKCSNGDALVAPVVASVANSKTTGRGPNNWSPGEPLRTITSTNTFGVIAPYLVPRYGEREGQEPRVRSVEEPSPVVVPDGNGGQVAAVHLSTFRSGATGHELSEPAKTITANSHDTNSSPGGRAPMGVVAANLVSYHGEKFDGESRGAGMEIPVHTLDCSNRHAVVASFLSQNNEGFYDGPGRPLDEPNPTVCASGSPQSLVAAHIQRDFGTSTGHKADQPVGTITGDGFGKAGLIASFLSKYYGQGIGQSVNEPTHTIPTVDRFGLVTVKIGDQTYFIEDIAMRMLSPRELYLAQGFRPGYIFDRGADGKPFSSTDQVHMCGNSVSPDVAESIAKANCPELIVRSHGRAA